MYTVLSEIAASRLLNLRQQALRLGGAAIASRTTAPIRVICRRAKVSSAFAVNTCASRDCSKPSVSARLNGIPALQRRIGLWPARSPQRTGRSRNMAQSCPSPGAAHRLTPSGPEICASAATQSWTGGVCPQRQRGNHRRLVREILIQRAVRDARAGDNIAHLEGIGALFQQDLLGRFQNRLEPARLRFCVGTSRAAVCGTSSIPISTGLQNTRRYRFSQHIDYLSMEERR